MSIGGWFRKIGRSVAPAFKKLGHDIVPAFKKLPSEVSWLGRQISTGANKVSGGLGQAENVINSINKYAPNPLTKTITGVLGGGLGALKGISTGVGLGGGALNQLGQGHLASAGNLARQGITTGSKGVAQGVASVAPAVALL